MEVGICVTILNTDHNNLVWSIHSGRLLDVDTCINTKCITMHHRLSYHNYIHTAWIFSYKLSIL